MQILEIKNFGPLKDVAITLNQFNIIIGPQASGKSTINKLIYFFVAIVKEELIAIINENLKFKTTRNIEEIFTEKLQEKFYDLFGDMAIQKNYSIKFTYNNEIYIELNLKEPLNLVFKFSERLNSLILDVPKTTKEISNLSDEADYYTQIESLYNHFSVYFDWFSSSFIIPAGRIYLSNFSDAIREQIFRYALKTGKFNKQNHIIDLTLESFIEHITFLRENHNSINHINHNQNGTLHYIDDFELIANSILKGKYIRIADIDHLKLNEELTIKLNLASSGQQEAVWIILHLKHLLLNINHSMSIIEEPEAHLFPETQYDIIKLIALTANATHSSFCISTHSPYLLTAFNNLMYAHVVGQKFKSEVETLFIEKLWIDPSKISVYELSNGTLTPIIDTENNLILVEKLDSASDYINNDYETLCNIFYQ